MNDILVILLIFIVVVIALVLLKCGVKKEGFLGSILGKGERHYVGGYDTKEEYRDHMFEQVEKNISARLLGEVEDKKASAEGLETLRAKFGGKIPDDVVEFVETMGQLGYNYGGPSLEYNKDPELGKYVEYDTWYKKWKAVMLSINDPAEFKSSIHAMQKQAGDLRKAAGIEYK